MLLNLSVDQALTKARSHAKKGEVVEAQKLYERILQNFSQNKRAQQGLADLNKISQKKTIQDPPEVLLNQLINLYNQGKYSIIVEQAQALSNQYPSSFMVWNIISASAAQIGNHDQAILAFEKVISLKPDHAEAYCNMGVSLQEKGKFNEAVEACTKAISLNPNYAMAYSNMGNALKDQGKLDEAIEAYKKAISLNPCYTDAYYNMGVTLKDKGKVKEALEAYNKTIQINPNYTLAHNNIGTIFRNQGNPNEAIKAYNKALSINPDHPEVHINLGYVLLNSGRLKEGLNEYEWRLKSSKCRQFLKPMWDGQKSLKDKRILIWCEQGVGDTIMWSSILLFLVSQAKHCILECQPKLVHLLRRSFPNVEVNAQDRSLDSVRDDFDYHLPMGSLYKNFIREISASDKIDTYLIPDPVRVEFWKKRLKSLGKGPYIGIGWKSSKMQIKRMPNYASISELSPILKIPNVTFVNLQYSDFNNDITKVKEELGVTVHNFDELDHFNNIDDVAALSESLDMVVSIANIVPLISAAVGTSTKLASWRQSPWNNVLMRPRGPLVDKFERNTWESWENVFNLIKHDILKFKKDKSNS